MLSGADNVVADTLSKMRLTLITGQPPITEFVVVMAKSQVADPHIRELQSVPNSSLKVEAIPANVRTQIHKVARIYRRRNSSLCEPTI